MSEPLLELPQNADEILRDFPFTEPNFEEHAKAIMATLGVSVGTVAGALSDDDLFRAPELAAEPGEPSLPALPSSVRAATAPKSNFAEMARRSMQKGEDDRAALAKELLAATAQSRRPNAEMVERVRAAGRVIPSATASPPPTGELERPSGVVTRAAAAGTALAPPAAVAKPASPQRGTIIGIIGVALAVAACVALYLKSNGPDQAPTSAALQAERAANAPAAAAKPAQAAPLAPNANQEMMNPEALAVAPLPAAAEAVKSAPGRVAAGAAAPVAKGGPAPSPGVKQETVDLQDDPAPPQAVAEKRPAEVAPEPQLKPAEGNGGSVPLSPSAGAISTALSSVRGGAQACLAGQSESVTANVVFAADGHVQSVRASGANAACIQAALSKAHIAPFAKESFSATTTIRPP